MRLGLLQEELPRAPSSERSGEMQGVVQRLELRSAASPVQPVGDPNVRQGIATKLYERIAMKLLPMTACAMALSVSIAAAQTQSNPGAGNTTTSPSTSAAPSDPVAPGGHWNVASAQCRELLGESDDDRAAIGMFYYGYLAAKLNRNTIDTSRIENDLRHVFETCHGHPDMTIVAAFKTLRSKGH